DAPGGPARRSQGSRSRQHRTPSPQYGRARVRLVTLGTPEWAAGAGAGRTVPNPVACSLALERPGMNSGGRSPLLHSRYPARAALLPVLLAGLLLGRAAEAQVAPPAFVPGRVLVQFKPGVTAARIHELLAAAGGQSVRQIAPIGVHIVQLPSQANP